MVNRVILIGRLGADPEVRYTQAGKPTASFTLATSETWKKDGEKKEKTEWHKIVTWDKLAEICGQYLTKGKLVFVEGKIQTRKWQDKEGNDKYTTEIVATNMKMLGGKSDEPTNQPAHGEAYEGPSGAGEEDVPF